MFFKKHIGRENILVLIGVIFILVYAIINIRIDWIPRYPDPFGYLTNAAYHVKKIDWSSITYQMQRLYSGGYSFFLIPFFYVSEDFISLTKYIYLLNLLFVCANYLLLTVLARRFLSFFSHSMKILVCIIISLSPYLFYNIFTITPEVLGTLGFTALVCCVQGVENGTKKNIFYIMGLFVAFGLIFIHSRFLMIYMCYWIITIVFMFLKKIKYYIGATSMLLMILGYWVYLKFNTFLESDVYNMRIENASNTMNSQIAKFSNNFSVEGVYSILQNFITQSFYLSFASFFLYLLIYYIGVKEIINILKHQKINITYIFTFFCTVGLALLSAFFFVNPSRIDHIIYGRYVEVLLPVIIVLGIKALREIYMKNIYFKILLMVLYAYLIASSKMIENRISSLELSKYTVRTTLSFNPFYEFLLENKNAYIALAKMAVIVLLIVLAIVKFFVGGHNDINGKKLIVCVFIMLVLHIFITENAIEREKEENKVFREPYIVFQKLTSFDNLNIYVVEDGSYNYLVQLLAYDESVLVISEDEVKSIMNTSNNFLVYDQKAKNDYSCKSLKYDCEEIVGNIWIGGDEYLKYLERSKKK